MADLGGPIAQLSGAISTLNRSWAATNSLWNDSVAQSFEKGHLMMLDAQVAATLREMERLAQVIAGARRHAR